ncbi:MAG: hypothetical protein COW54_00735 [Rhodobacteraceae bacterium CG17_big_fil_post_rev_8_21_14_2_50_63_15]|nr:OmpA family protein [Roseovarius sp.]PIV80076.1 MAG: hypothetical protein COW54_00735 [Rhodobacteraceae bacterium CG17_big_fil_post_rev_8_21_14_2_50_63_15]
MNRKAFKSTTSFLIAISLLQPLPSLAQSSPDASVNDVGNQTEEPPSLRAPEEVCAEAKILDELECGLHIMNLEAVAAASATVAPVGSDTPEQVEPDALAVREAEAQAAADAQEAEARAAADAQEAEARAAADAQEAEARTEPETQADAAPAAVTEAAAEVPAEDEQQTDTATSSASTDQSEACLAEAIASDGSVVCVDALTDDSIKALATEIEAAPSAEVTTETITEQTQRSSSEEFPAWTPEGQVLGTTAQGVAPNVKSKNGMSDLQKAGLLALGAVVVGAILLNGQRVEANTGDRVVVVDDDNAYRILKDDDALLRQPGSDIRTERFSDGSTRSNVLRADGTEIITIRDSGGRVLRRVLVETDGRQYVLFDDSQSFEPVVIRDLPEPVFEDFDYQAASDRDGLRLALLAADRRDIGRSFSLRQVREIHEVRQLSPEINLRNITFATNSSAIQPSQAQELRQMGLLMRDLIADDPTELFLIEGYTDAIGAPGYNLLLSDRRAESVALALSEYFDVPPENMVIQGYGESFLKISTQDAERLNRRVAVRRITTLVRKSRL